MKLKIIAGTPEAEKRASTFEIERLTPVFPARPDCYLQCYVCGAWGPSAEMAADISKPALAKEAFVGKCCLGSVNWHNIEARLCSAG